MSALDPPLRRASKSSDHVVCLAAIGALAKAGGSDVINDFVSLFSNITTTAFARRRLKPRRDTIAEIYVDILRVKLRDSSWEVLTRRRRCFGKSERHVHSGRVGTGAQG